jgi:hypothetical protein
VKVAYIATVPGIRVHGHLSYVSLDVIDDTMYAWLETQFDSRLCLDTCPEHQWTEITTIKQMHVLY